jgi:outer membrane protein TolC
VTDVLNICFLCLGLCAGLRAEKPSLELGLKQVEEAALSNARSLKAAENELAAADYKSWSVATLMLPRLSADGTWRYQTEVPSLVMPLPKPLPAPTLQFGDNTNYSVGPTLSWNIWDSGVSYNLWQSAKAMERAKAEDLRAQKNEMKLKARLEYFQTQLAGEQVLLMSEDLKLAQSRDKDMRVQLAAGSSSRIDALAARNEVLLARGRLRQARLDLAGCVRDLQALTSLAPGADPALPEDARVAEAGEPADSGEATLLVRLDSLEQSLLSLQGAQSAILDKDHPRLAQLKELVEAAQRQAESAGSANWLKVQGSLRASLDYPNGPVLENVNQKSAYVSATMPLFAFGQAWAQTGEQEKNAQAGREREAQLCSDMKRDWLKARDSLASLKDLKEIYALSVKETQELYRLVYDAYKNGSSSYLEVQDASVHALQAKVQAARIDVQILIQLAILDSMGE